MNILVTIAIASYNNSLFIERCVDSVINQTYHQLEIIIVDDGSTDNTLDRIEKYKSDIRVKIVRKENGGLSSVRQMSLDIATGDYICFIDADDYLEKTYVEKMLSKLLADKSQVCVCSTKFVDQKGFLLRSETQTFSCYDSSQPIIASPEKLTISNNPELKQLHLSDSWNKMYGVPFLKKTGVRFSMPKGMNGTDTLFNRLLFLHKPVYSTIKEECYVHVIYSSSAVHRKKKDLLGSFMIINEKMIEECENLNIRSQLDIYLTLKLYSGLHVACIDFYNEENGYFNTVAEFRKMRVLHKKYMLDHNMYNVNITDIEPNILKIFVFVFSYLIYLVPTFLWFGKLYGRYIHR